MWLIIALIILLLLSAFFSSAETALVSLPEYKLKKLLLRKNKNAKTLNDLKNKPKSLIITILIGNNIVNIAAASIATKIALDYFGNTGIGIATGIMTLLILTFGEILPKAYATIHAEKLALKFAKPIRYMKVILSPFVFFFLTVTNLVFKLFKNPQKTEGLTEEEIISLLRLGSEKRVIDKDERELMENVLELDDTNVSEIKTKIEDVFMLDENLTIKEAIESINNNQYSRIPIYSQTQNNITGFIHIKDVLLNLYSNNTLKQIKKEALFVRYNKKAGDVLENMQNTGTHLACVLDKNKNVCGIITMEDLIEEIFGEIYDEKELTPHRPIKINKNIYLMHINTKISKINEIFPNSLPKVYDSLTILEFISGKISSFEQKKCLITDNLKLKIQSTMRGKPKIIKVIKLNKKNI